MKKMMLVPATPYQEPTSEKASRIELFKTDRNILKQVGSLDIIEEIFKLRGVSDETKVKLIEKALANFIVSKEQSKGASVDTPSGKPSVTQNVIEQLPEPVFNNEEPTMARKPKPRRTLTEKKKAPLVLPLEPPADMDKTSVIMKSPKTAKPNRPKFYPSAVPEYSDVETDMDLEPPPEPLTHDQLMEDGQTIKLLKSLGVTWDKRGTIKYLGAPVKGSHIGQFVRTMNRPGSTNGPFPAVGLKEVLDTMEKNTENLRKHMPQKDADEEVPKMKANLKEVRRVLLKNQEVQDNVQPITKWKIPRK